MIIDQNWQLICCNRFVDQRMRRIYGSATLILSAFDLLQREYYNSGANHNDQKDIKRFFEMWIYKHRSFVVACNFKWRTTWKNISSVQNKGIFSVIKNISQRQSLNNRNWEKCVDLSRLLIGKVDFFLKIMRINCSLKLSMTTTMLYCNLLSLTKLMVLFWCYIKIQKELNA